MNQLYDFFKSDVQNLEGRDHYLGYAKNIKLGHHDELSLTGNAYNTCFTTKGVTIENLWDDNLPNIFLGLDDFIERLTKWLPNKDQ